MIEEKNKNNIDEIIKKYVQEHNGSDQVSDTIYDDVIRSICERFLWMLIPLVNHTLGTNYSREAKIRLLLNEHHNAISSKMDTRITDAYFEIAEDGVIKQYHLECQGKSDEEEIKNNKNIAYVEQEIENVMHVIKKALDEGKINVYKGNICKDSIWNRVTMVALSVGMVAL